jgi:hypothetical protein
MKNLNRHTSNKGFTHLICGCGAHYYSHMISFLSNEHETMPTWYSPKEWLNFVESGNRKDQPQL